MCKGEVEGKCNETTVRAVHNSTQLHIIALIDTVGCMLQMYLSHWGKRVNTLLLLLLADTM